MSLRNTSRHAALGTLAAALLLWLLGAPRLHAQTLYEWREPSGALAYSQVALITIGLVGFALDRLMGLAEARLGAT